MYFYPTVPTVTVMLQSWQLRPYLSSVTLLYCG